MGRVFLSYQKNYVFNNKLNKTCVFCLRNKNKCGVQNFTKTIEESEVDIFLINKRNNQNNKIIIETHTYK